MFSTRVEYNLLNFNLKRQYNNLFWSCPAQAGCDYRHQYVLPLQLEVHVHMEPLHSCSSLCSLPAFSPSVTSQRFFGALPSDLHIKGIQQTVSDENISLSTQCNKMEQLENFKKPGAPALSLSICAILDHPLNSLDLCSFLLSCEWLRPNDFQRPAQD